MDILNQTLHGKILKCKGCKVFHIEFNNLNFNFKKDEYDFFKDAILSIDGEKWERVNKNCSYHRKIMVPIGHKSFNILLNIEELQELKQLLTGINSKFPNNLREYKVCNLNFITNLN